MAEIPFFRSRVPQEDLWQPQTMACFKKLFLFLIDLAAAASSSNETVTLLFLISQKVATVLFQAIRLPIADVKFSCRQYSSRANEFEFFQNTQWRSSDRALQFSDLEKCAHETRGENFVIQGVSQQLVVFLYCLAVLNLPPFLVWRDEAFWVCSRACYFYFWQGHHRLFSLQGPRPFCVAMTRRSSYFTILLYFCSLCRQIIRFRLGFIGSLPSSTKNVAHENVAQMKCTNTEKFPPFRSRVGWRHRY